MPSLSTCSQAAPNISMSWWTSHMLGVPPKGDKMPCLQGELLKGETNKKLLCRKGAGDHEEEV